MNLSDFEKTSAETRARHAALWNEDVYKVVEDMHHCAKFIMRDELADLLSDGLVAMRDELTESQAQEWELIIEAIKLVEIDHTLSPEQSFRAYPKIQAALMAQSEHMVRLLDRIDER